MSTNLCGMSGQKQNEPQGNRGELRNELLGNYWETSNEELVYGIQAGAEVAENMRILWLQNIGFITKVALKYQHYAEMDDLKQEGYLGLCEAARHYDASQGVPFINYAAFWMHQGMQRYIENCGSVVRIPTHAREWLSKYRKMMDEYQKRYGTEPSDEEICGCLHVGWGKLQAIRESARMGQIRSLSEPVGDAADDLKIEGVTASGEDIEGDIIKRLDAQAMSRELWIAVDQLPGQQPEIIKKRYQERLTVREVGECLGVGTGMVRQLEAKAMRTLRIPGRNRKFRGYHEEYMKAACCHHVGIESFRRTWTSEVEREALKL